MTSLVMMQRMRDLGYMQSLPCYIGGGHMVITSLVALGLPGYAIAGKSIVTATTHLHREGKYE